MTPLRGRLVMLVLTTAVLFSPLNVRAATDVCSGKVVPITIAYDNVTGACTQTSGGSTSSAAVLVTLGNCVQFTAGGQSVEVQFDQGASPFYDLKAGATQTVTTGPVGGKAGDAYNYQSVQVGGNYCLNGRTLGLIMR